MVEESEKDNIMRLVLYAGRRSIDRTLEDLEPVYWVSHQYTDLTVMWVQICGAPWLAYTT